MDDVTNIPSPVVPAPSDDDRNMALLAHLSALLLGIIGPLIFWVVKKDESPFVDAVGKTALNFNISYSIYMMVSGLLIFILIGLLIFPIFALMWFIFVIMAALKAKDGENWVPPLTIELLK